MSNQPLHQAPAHSALLELLPDALQQFAAWQAGRWHAYDTDETLHVPADKARAVLAALLARLDDN